MRTCLIALLSVLPGSFAPAAEIDYLKQVKPILKARCYSCHGALKQEGELRLDTVVLMRKGGESGPAINAKSLAKSQLLHRIMAKGESERMPPEGEPLKPGEIKLIQAWILAGAKGPAKERPQSDPRKHWAFQRPVRPQPPKIRDAKWVINPIDRFVAARREKHNIKPLAPASKPVLLRRVYLDLIGIPPTRQQLQAFLDDTSPDAYERVVDGLLKSKRHGERWGRHWMDVWRYSDWYGRRKVPDVLNSYAQIWRWRDWIIRSVNDDKGYDQMVKEMLAADELDPGNDKTAVATGFVLRNFYRWNYNNWMKDNVEHTGKAFLALTLNCCHCHDHKYDPLTNKEYFRFRAFFEPLEVRHDRVAGEPDPGPYPKYKYGASYKPIKSGLVRVMDEKLDAKTFMYTKGEARNIIPGLPPVQPGAPSILGGEMKVTRVKLPAESWYPGTKDSIRKEEIAKRQKQLDAAYGLLAKAKKYLAAATKELRLAEAASTKSQTKAKATKLTAARKKFFQARMTMRVDQTHVRLAQAEMQAVKARIHADNVRFKGHKGDKKKVAQAAHRAERMPAVLAAELAVAREERAALAKVKIPASIATNKEIPVNKLIKVSTKLTKLRAVVKKAQVAAKVVSEKYTLFGPQYPKYSTGRRAALAKWIGNKKNPLTARVAANHIWARHFGRAIVKSTENFGRNGDMPTHPKLLDWLAVELMAGDWKMKRIHRLIVTSATYRQASSVPPRNTAQYKHYQRMKQLDRDNVLIWRYNSRRMEAEAVRDSMLQVAGQLDLTMFGKEISQKLGLTNRRRSVYFDHHGEGRMQLLDLFDAADPCDCYRRSSSVRPHQALALANSQLAIEQGRFLARDLNKQLPNASSREFAEVAFKQVLCRAASVGELAASVAFLEQQEKLFLTVSKPAKKQPTAVTTTKTKAKPASGPSLDPRVRAREGLVQALFSHSDFVTIR